MEGKSFPEEAQIKRKGNNEKYLVICWENLRLTLPTDDILGVRDDFLKLI